MNVKLVDFGLSNTFDPISDNMGVGGKPSPTMFPSSTATAAGGGSEEILTANAIKQVATWDVHDWWLDCVTQFNVRMCVRVYVCMCAQRLRIKFWKHERIARPLIRN